MRDSGHEEAAATTAADALLAPIEPDLALARELVAAAEDVRGSVRGLMLPIKFSSLEQEVRPPLV